MQSHEPVSSISIGLCFAYVYRKISVISNGNTFVSDPSLASPPSLPSHLHLHPPPKQPLYNQPTMAQSDYREMLQPRVVCFTCANLVLGFVRLCVISSQIHKGVINKVGVCGLVSVVKGNLVEGHFDLSQKSDEKMAFKIKSCCVPTLAPPPPPTQPPAPPSPPPPRVSSKAHFKSILGMCSQPLVSL